MPLRVNNASYLSRRTFLQAASGLFSRPPNIVFILADDLGFGDLGCYGGRDSTPNIDALAYGGIRFTCHESTAPVCSASRTALLTGQYTQRLGIRQLNSVIFPENSVGLPAVITIADRLRSQGYFTGHVGKWHLGHYATSGNYRDSEFHPTNRGFDFSRGIPYSNDMGPNLYDNGTEVLEFPDTERKNLTARFYKDSLEFLRQAQNQTSPFFLFLALTAPHVPTEPSYSDVLMEMDNAVGKVMNVLGPNTIVFLTSDNGADQTQPDGQRGNNGNLKDGKYRTYEGGTRVPFVVNFPGVVPSGRVCDELSSMLDVSNTLCSIAGLPADDHRRGLSDGVDLWPLLKGEITEASREKPLLYFRYGDPECAVIRATSSSGQTALFKFRFAASGRRLEIPEVYNITTGADPGEQYNITTSLPLELIARVREDVRQQLLSFPTDSVNMDLV